MYEISNAVENQQNHGGVIIFESQPSTSQDTNNKHESFDLLKHMENIQNNRPTVIERNKKYGNNKGRNQGSILSQIKQNREQEKSLIQRENEEYEKRIEDLKRLRCAKINGDSIRHSVENYSSANNGVDCQIESCNQQHEARIKEIEKQYDEQERELQSQLE